MPIDLTDNANNDGTFGTAPGGRIQQAIKRDRNPAEHWDTEHGLTFNVSIVDTGLVERLSGKALGEPFDELAYRGEVFDFEDDQPGVHVPGKLKSIRLMNLVRRTPKAYKVTKIGNAKTAGGVRLPGRVVRI